MKLIREEPGKALFESLGNTFHKSSTEMVKWNGWFTTEEAGWEIIKK